MSVQPDKGTAEDTSDNSVCEKLCGWAGPKRQMAAHKHDYHTVSVPIMVEGNIFQVQRDEKNTMRCPFTECVHDYESRKQWQRHVQDKHSVVMGMFWCNSQEASLC